MVIHKNKNGLTYSGAGVLIIEDYHTKKGTFEPCLLLVRDKTSKVYMDFGGQYDKKHMTLENTAHHELREESANLFNVGPNNFDTYVDIPSGKHFYRAFLLKINGASKKYFHHNVKLMVSLRKSGHSVPRSWRETDDIAHIPIKNINFAVMCFKKKIILNDIHKKQITLHNRTKHAIFHAQSNIMQLINMRPLAKRKNIRKHKSRYFTNNTHSYVIK